MKILYITTIASTMHFFSNYISELVEKGNTVDIVCNNSSSTLNPVYNELGCKVYNVPFSRLPLTTGNLEACKMLKKIVNDNKYDIIHCHTPIASACARFVCRKVRKKGTRVFYTAHGFHFYKGSPFINKLVFYPIEKICAHYTDTLITINSEDFALAKKKLKAKKVAYVQGVGINIEKFRNANVNREEKREEIGVPKDAYTVISIGELNKNKNHQAVISAISKINDSNVHYVIVGDGPLKEYLENLKKECGVSDRVHLLGKRRDVSELLKCADVYVHPSYREGLPVAVMEAMTSGLPCIVSDIRGNRDLIVHEKGGIVIEENNAESYKNAIINMRSCDSAKYSLFNMNESQNYSIDKINTVMRELYGIN